MTINVFLIKKALLLLIFSILIPFSLNAQTTIERDSIVAKIQTLAKRHVANNENMKTEHVVNLFKDNKCGLSQLELTDIYEDQYILSKNEDSSLWNRFRPNIGWIGIVVVFVLGILVTSIRKLITNIFQNLWDRFYKKFSGSKLLRRRAIKKYKDSLYNKYKKVEISFRQGKPLNMADIFIPLKVTTNTGKNVEILEVEDAITLYDKVIIVGNPGSGKSMFCKNILFKYSNKEVKKKRFSILSLSSFYRYRNKPKVKKFPILIELHRLSDKTATIFTLLENELTKNSFPNSSNFLNIGLTSGDLFILFDGYDEIASSERSRVTQLINDFIERYKKCQYVITSRTAVYDKEFKEATEVKLKLIDFNQQQIRRFLHSWWNTEIREGKSVEQLINTLQDRPRIMSLATNPLMLTMIACLYADTEEYILPHSRAEFYDKATTFFLEPKNGIANKYRYPQKLLILQHLALFNQQQGEKQQDRKLISFTEAIEEIRKVLPDINLKADDIQTIIEEIVERSGLLIKVDGGEHYQFAHLTLQEYFAAKQLNDKQDELLEKFKLDRQTWRETIKLWCGITNDATTMISYLYEIEPIIAFECISEAKRIEQNLANDIINYFIGLIIDAENSNVEIEKAFGVLASDTRQRGENIFNLLVSRFNSSGNEKEIVIIGNALSYTYLPKAAKIISNSCFKNQELYKCLIRMGDIAIDELVRLSLKEDIKAILTLKQIASPRAGQALMSLLWKDDEISKIAAWCLAELILNSNIKKEISESVFTQRQLKSEICEWAYQQNDTQRSENLHFIIGRVVYLISKPIEFKQDIEFYINPIVSIPVIINQFALLNKESWEIDDIPKSKKIDISVEDIYYIEHKLDQEKMKETGQNTDKVSFEFLMKICYVKNKYFIKKEEIAKKGSLLLKFIDKDKFPIFFNISNSLRNNILEIFTTHGKFGSKNDWINLLRKDMIDYEFASSWHYKIILTVFTILSISSIMFCIYSIKGCIDCSSFWRSIQIIGCIVMVFNVIIYLFISFDGAEFSGFTERPKHLFRYGVFGFLFFRDPIKYYFNGNYDEKDYISAPPIYLLSTMIWTPFILYYNYLLLRQFLPDTIILTIALIVIIGCTILAIYGNRLEKTSMNPLKILKENIGKL